MPHPKPDFASASLRHIRDAEFLLNAHIGESPDQAWHLAGFAHECARKACLSEGWVPKLLGHDFSAVGELVVELAVSLDPAAGRFPVRQWAETHPAVKSWRPDHRYEATGTAATCVDRSISDLVGQGRSGVDACVLALYLEGALSDESLT